MIKDAIASIFNKEGRASITQFLLGAIASPIVVILFLSPDQQTVLYEETRKIADAIETIIGSAKTIGVIIVPLISLWLARIAGATDVKSLLAKLLEKKPDAVVIGDREMAAQAPSANVIPKESVKVIAADRDVAMAAPSEIVVPADKVEIKA